MKTSFFWLATVVALALPLAAQTSIPAPVGWTTQTKANGAVTFTPPDLRAGEKYSVTVYDSAPLGDQTSEEYLRAFAGPVGKTAGKLGAPLQMQKSEETTIGFGTYVGPNGTGLRVVFFGTSLTGSDIHVARILFSDPALVMRYADRQKEILVSMARRARAEAGSNLVEVPEIVREKMKPGGAIVPGLYVGNQYDGEELKERFWIHLYANGECRIANSSDESSGHDDTYRYQRNTGQLDISWTRNLTNIGNGVDLNFCYYGRDSAKRPLIFAEKWRTIRTLLTYAGPNKLPSPSLLKEREATRQAAREAASEEEKNRLKWVTQPGQGVPASQIAAIVHHSASVESTTNSPDLVSMAPGYVSPDGEFTPGTLLYTPGVPVTRIDITDDAYLLLRDGTVYSELQVAPDQFDAPASRRKEPGKWGKWKQEAGKTKVSFGGRPPYELPDKKVLSGTAQTRLSGRYNFEGGSISFTPAGRFKRSPLSPKGDPSARYTLTQGQKTLAGGDLAGTYSIQDYALTLRYDGGQVERMLFFSEDPRYQSVWFEGGWIGLDKPKAK